MRRRVLNALAWCLMLIIVALGASACTTTGGSFCAVSRPIRLSQSTITVMTDQEVAAVLSHNQKLQKLCGVKP